MKPIELRILFYSDELQDENDPLVKLGIYSQKDDFVIDTMTFYNIDGIAPHRGENGEEFSSIFSSGDNFICIESYQDLVDKVNKNLE